jgi:hypothetical protein
MNRAELAPPAQLCRARHGSFYVPLPGEEAAAIRAAESFLIDFCGADFDDLPWQFRPAAIRAAQGHLLVVYLNNPVIADAFVNAVAVAAALTKAELRRQLHDRAEFLTHLPRIIEVNRKGALQELEKWLLQ